MHELRRPLQALALLDDQPATAGRAAGNGSESARRGLLELARSALSSLDGELNGGAPAPLRREVSCRELVCAAVERWRPLAGDSGVRLYWDAGPAPVVCDPVRLAQALDNLFANAIEHGGPPVVVTGASVAGRLRITVANGNGNGKGKGKGKPPVAEPAGAGGNGVRGRNGRRGHGVELVSEFAGEQRGRFALCRTESGCVAALEVPLTDGSLARAA